MRTRRRYRWIGLAYDAMEPGLYLDDFVPTAYLLPYPSTDREKYLDRLLDVCAREKVEAIIPVFDSELPHYINNRARFEEAGIRFLLPSRDRFDRVRKERLPALARELGVAVPETIAVTTHEELTHALDRLGLPVMMKGLFYEAYRVATHVEARHKFDAIALKWGYPVLVQRYVEGTDYNVVGCCGRGGVNLGLVAVKKLLVTQAGKIWSAVTIRHEGLDAAARRFVEGFGWEGGFELEFRLAPDDSVHLLEINPRFPAWIYLAAAAGINLPDRYLRNVLDGEKRFKMDYEVGKMLVRYTGEVIKEIGDFERIVVNGEKR